MFCKALIGMILLLFVVGCGKELNDKQSSSLNSPVEEDRSSGVLVVGDGESDDGHSDDTEVITTPDHGSISQVKLPNLSINPDYPDIPSYFFSSQDFEEGYYVNALPNIYPRSEAPVSKYIAGVEEGSIDPNDLHKYMKSNINFSGEPSYNQDDFIPFQSIPSGQDSTIKLKKPFDPSIVNWIEWHIYGPNCTGGKTWTVYGEGDHGLAGNQRVFGVFGQSIYAGYNDNNELLFGCLTATNVRFVANGLESLTFKSPAPGFQGVVYYNVSVNIDLNDDGEIPDIYSSRIEDRFFVFARP